MKNNAILILFAILSLSLLYFIQSEDGSREPLHLKMNLPPQEYMANAYLTSFEENGNLKEEITANRWAYLSEAKISTLSIPHLIIYKPDGTIWFIDAKKGTLKQPSLGTIEQIELQENVVIERPGTTTIVPLKLKTEKMSYQPKKQYAESAEPVVMTKPGLKITGTGLRAFLERDKVELLHNVKTFYLVQ